MKPSAAQARDRELVYLTAAELGRHYRARELSPVEVTEAVLRRIERLGPALNAFVLVDTEAALASARASEARFARQAPLGPLDGVSVSLKDLLLARGWPTRSGSKTVDARAAWLEDSPAAARLREGGAVLLGKTTTSEFGLRGMGDSPLTGITRNPWNLQHTPGGSSAGAVAAVAAGLGCLAVGTDGGGSIRVPAAYTGVVGLKPSYGRVPSYPASVIGAPPHVGPITRSVHDAQLLLGTLARSDDRDPYRAPEANDAAFASALPLRALKVGYLAGAQEQCTKDVREAFDGVLAMLRELGLQPVAVDLSLDGAQGVLTTLFNARAAHTLRNLSAVARSEVDSSIELAAREGERLIALDYLAAEAERTALALRVAHVFRSYDLLLTPTAAEPAPRVDAEFSPKRAPFTGMFSLTRQPAISIPCGVTREGLPIGLQIVGRHFEEALVLQLAAGLEAGNTFAQPPEPASDA
jgi:aspartyl-tRNA(Asn)/glutamyl-tRNA(Gln) amidotransferase subunit A